MNDKSIRKTAAEFNKFITVQSHTIQSMKFVVCVATNTSPCCRVTCILLYNTAT